MDRQFDFTCRAQSADVRQPSDGLRVSVVAVMPLDGSRSDGWDSDITASGAKGQWLFIVPKYDMVVAVTSGGTTCDGYIDPVNFLYSEILPAVISRE